MRRALTSVGTGDGAGGEDQGPVSRLWHVTLSVSGKPAPLSEVRRGLEQLAHDHPFLLTSRYADDHAEIRYWEEARDLHDAAAVALRLWGEHRSTARLPALASWDATLSGAGGDRRLPALAHSDYHRDPD
ncbi:hypothetical protein AB0O29_29575, partial [Streptomyces sp. NPDC089915]